MSTSWPLLRNWPQISANRSQAMTLWYSVLSPPPPPRNSLVATTNVASGLPLGSVRSSGSRVKRPTSMTLFIPIPPARFTGFSAPGRVGGSGTTLRRTAYRGIHDCLSARTWPSARIEMVDAGCPKADLGHRRHLPLVLHARHAGGDPLHQVPVKAGGHAPLDRPSAVHEREERPIEVVVRAAELVFIGLAWPQVGGWRLRHDLRRDAQVLGHGPQLGLVQVAD